MLPAVCSSLLPQTPSGEPDVRYDSPVRIVHYSAGDWIAGYIVHYVKLSLLFY